MTDRRHTTTDQARDGEERVLRGGKKKQKMGGEGGLSFFLKKPFATILVSKPSFFYIVRGAVLPSTLSPRGWPFFLSHFFLSPPTPLFVVRGLHHLP